MVTAAANCIADTCQMTMMSLFKVRQRFAGNKGLAKHGGSKVQRQQHNNNDNNNVQEPLELFVPGRICLFGEHTDWAGGSFRPENDSIPIGMCMLSGTEEGLYARVSKNDKSGLKLHCTLDDGRQETAEYEWDDEVLLGVAQSGQHWSYVCGVALVMKQRYPQITGMVLDIYRTTLPFKKGLSSSAAVCVLTARAQSRLYHLHLTILQEMDYAFLGETTTPSKCGRMDQGCAYGPCQPIVMKFDGNNLSVEPLRVGGTIHVVIAT